MKKITIEEFVKRVNALQAGEHISVQLIENGYIVTAFATLVKGNRYHFMMVEGFYGNCEQGFEGFDEQGIHEYIDYVKMLSDDTSELEEITELIVWEEQEEKKPEPKPTKSLSMYLTVRVDLSCPEDMDESDAKSLALQEFDYDFKLFPSASNEGIVVESTEICDVNDEF